MKTRQRKARAPMKRKESDLCEALMVKARAEGWIVYPETADFDIILVAPFPLVDLPKGTMIGVEAKLTANCDVLAQATSRGFGNRQRTGPDFRHVLVPTASRSFRDVARQLRVGVWTDRDLTSRRPLRPAHAFRWEGKRPWLPPVIPEGSAGVPSPRTLTRWRVKALRVCNRIADQNEVTTADFREVGINHSTWLRAGWIVADGKIGRRTRYVPADPLPDDYPLHGFEAEALKLRQFDRSA